VLKVEGQWVKNLMVKKEGDKKKVHKISALKPNHQSKWNFFFCSNPKIKMEI